jgi:hypothetical protein
MSWGFIAALFGVDAKTIDYDAFGTARIWTDPGIIGARVNMETGLVTGPLGETVGHLRDGPLDQLQLTNPLGQGIGTERVDSVGVEHWVAPNNVEIGQTYFDAAGHAHDLDARQVQFATEYTSQDQLRIDWASPGLQAQSQDAGFSAVGGENLGLEVVGTYPSGLDLGGLGGFDPGSFDVGIDPGLLSSGFDSSLLDGLDF